MPLSCAESASAICLAIDKASATGQAPALEPRGQRFPFHQLEDQARDAIRLFQPVNRADVRVIQRGKHARLAHKPRAAFGIAGEVRRQTLDRDVATELAVARAVHLAHAARAKA
jgi:hypothetical protein